MAPEYLDQVNQELLEIETFFVELYQTSSTLPSLYTPGLLPYLRLNNLSISHNSSESKRTSKPLFGDDCDLDDCGVDGGKTPMSTAQSSSLFSKSEELFAAELRVRYKQLKAIQDQLRLELTRHQLWHERILYEKAIHPTPQTLSQSHVHGEPAQATRHRDASTAASPSRQVHQASNQDHSDGSSENMTDKYPSIADAATLFTESVRGCFRRRLQRTAMDNMDQSPALSSQASPHHIGPNSYSDQINSTAAAIRRRRVSIRSLLGRQCNIIAIIITLSLIFGMTVLPVLLEQHHRHHCHNHFGRNKHDRYAWPRH